MFESICSILNSILVLLWYGNIWKLVGVLLRSHLLLNYLLLLPCDSAVVAKSVVLLHIVPLFVNVYQA